MNHIPWEQVKIRNGTKGVMVMPPRGKCQSCGRTAFLTAKVLRNRETGELYCLMVCGLCKYFYEQLEEKTDGD